MLQSDREPVLSAINQSNAATPSSPSPKSDPGDSIEEKLNSAMEIASRCFLVCLLAFLLSIVGDLLDLIKKFHSMGFSSNVEDFLWVAPGYLHSLTVYYICTTYLSKYVKPIISESKMRSNESEASQLWRYGNLLFGIYYYIFSYGTLLYLVWGTDYCPKLYGGTLDLGNTIRIWPYEAPYVLRVFYMLTLGHHSERLVKEIVHHKQKAFWTLFFHHLLTMLLLILSFFSKHYQYGVVILLIHDFTDIWLNFSRLFREMREPYYKIALITFGVCVLSWIHSRLYLFIKEVFIDGFVYSLLRLPKMISEHMPVHWFFLFALLLLLFLNVFWFMQMIKIIYIVYVKRNKQLPFEDHKTQKSQ